MISYTNKKINSITFENLCEKDGNCSYNSKNSSFHVNNIVAQKIFTPDLDIIPNSYDNKAGRINFIEGEIYCHSLGCGLSF